MSSGPKRAQHVILRLPADNREIAAKVDEDDGDIITLVLSSAEETIRWDGRAVVEYTTPRGVHTVTGELTGTGESPEVVRIRRDEYDVIQRRDFVRVDAVVPLQVTIDDPVKGAIATTTLNVSAGGVLLQDPLGLPFECVVDLELQLEPGAPPVRARGRVVREVTPDVKGVQIDSIARDDRERLVRYVTERERMAARVARGR